MATRYLHPALAGIRLAGVMAAIMSTAAAQLLVASSAFAQDFYRGLLRRDAGRRELLWAGRRAVLAIATLAFRIARDPSSKVLGLVAWAWAGFGSPPQPCSEPLLCLTPSTNPRAIQRRCCQGSGA
jgi:sodium/proline symporter